MKKLLALLLVVSLVFAFSACGGKETAQPTDSPASDGSEPAPDDAAKTDDAAVKDLEIKDFSYYVDNGFLMYAITLHNPNESKAIELPSFRITGKAADGTILGSEDQTLSVVYPGLDFVYAGQAFEVSETPDDVKVELLPSAEYNIKDVSLLDHPEYKPLVVENTSLQEGDYMKKITGEIRNDNDYAISSAVVSVICRDAEGKLVGSQFTFVDSVAAGTTTPFEISLYSDTITEPFEVFADNWM